MSEEIHSLMYWKLHNLDTSAIFWECARVKTAPLKSSGAKNLVYFKISDCDRKAESEIQKIYMKHTLMHIFLYAIARTLCRFLWLKLNSLLLRISSTVQRVPYFTLLLVLDKKLWFLNSWWYDVPCQIIV